MMVQDELAHAGAPAIDTLDSNDPWQSRSSEELRALASRGIHGGDLYFAAVAELERRARMSEASADAEKAELAAQRREVIISFAILFAAVDAAIVLRLLGF